MILVLFSWVLIFISAFLWGFGVLQLLGKWTGYTRKSFDMELMMGLCFLTVYTQIFSLFYEVGTLAFIVHELISLCIFLIWRREIFREIKERLHRKGILYRFLILGVLTVILTVLSSGMILHYDTNLYHAQSIRWIEEYGIVPGLGNLHNRLAYNSSVFCLQALFGLRFLVGQSLHSVNGFVALLLIGYALCTMKVFRERRFWTSDFLRLGILIYFSDVQSYLVISSPGSDFLALGLVLYILIKWVDYIESGEKETAPYAYLCLLGVYAVTVKLSAAMIVLLVLMPAVKLVRAGKWKEIALYLSTGILILLPFLIRNVIISGYLVYPYPELDLFDVDWKMPAYTLLFDRNEIKAWGWGLNDVRLFDTPLKEWFPTWISTLSSPMRILFYLNFVLDVMAATIGIYKGIKQKDWNFLLVTGTIIANFLLWFIGSPLPRYGSVYIVILPLLMLGEAAARIRANRSMQWISLIVMVTAGVYFVYPVLRQSVSGDLSYKKRCADYAQFSCQEYYLGDEVIYVPDQGDQAGYYAFPSTPYAARLDLIELRGDFLKEGFCMKEEYRNGFVSTYGEVSEENMFDK